MEAEELRVIIASAKAGEAEGYEALLEAYGRRLYGYFLRATRNRDDAEDMLSDMMYRLVKTLKRYEHKGRFEPWLFRIAANMVRDRIRRQKTRPTPMSLSAETDSGGQMGSNIQGASTPVDAKMLAAELSLELNEALEKVDETTREMILMRHFAEMSFKEIAEMFDCPIGTALAKVHRGLKTLRQIIGGEDDDS